MNQIWGTILVAVLSSSVIGTVVTVLVSRRKISAEGTKILAEANAVQSDTVQKATDRAVLRVQADNDRLRDDMDKMRRRHDREMRSLKRELNELEDRERIWLNILQLHAGWDALAIAKLRSAGVDLALLPDPPPLTPPNTFTRTHVIDSEDDNG